MPLHHHLVYDPVRARFLRPIFAADPYVEDLIVASSEAAVTGFEAVASFRLATQKRTFGWGVAYTKWYGRVFQKYGDEPENKPLMILLAGGMIVSFLPFGFATGASYLTPVSAAVAAPLDIWNIYKYIS